MRRPLNWVNERNPYRVLQVSHETAPAKVHNILLLRISAGEEGGDDVKSAWPSDALGYTRVTMVGTMGRQGVSRS